MLAASGRIRDSLLPVPSRQSGTILLGSKGNQIAEHEGCYADVVHPYFAG
ncbi:MAG: hypothetical protein OXD30_07935 [Bryobacterales bacterium]|nr:hypothetical protein [Bryobacterales bacterium]